MAPIDMAPNLGGDPMALVLLRLLAGRAQGAQGGAGAPQNPSASPTPAGMTQPRQQAATPVATGAARPVPPAISGTAPQNAVSPEKPMPPTLAANKTQASDETGNRPPGPMNAPVLSEEDYDARNPIAANPNPYRAPGIANRLMAGLSGAFATLSGDRAAGQDLIGRYMNQQQALRDASNNYGADAEAARHKGYMDYVKAQGDIAGVGEKNAQARADDARADDALAEQRERDRETLEQQYADAVKGGDKTQASNLLGAIKELTSAQTKATDRHTPYEDWRAENPNAPVKDWLDLMKSEKPTPSPRSSAGGKGAKDYAIQKAAIETRKNESLGKLERAYGWNPQTSRYEDPLGVLPPLNTQQWQQRKDAIQKTADDAMRQLRVNTGGGKGGNAKPFVVPQGAPAAPREDGHVLNMNGKPIAVSKGGQWVAPPNPSSR